VKNVCDDDPCKIQKLRLLQWHDTLCSSQDPKELTADGSKTQAKTEAGMPFTPLTQSQGSRGSEAI
jgi:hypothetical protein